MARAGKRGWTLAGATKDRQSVTSAWKRVGPRRISGVTVREVRNVLKEGGVLTEIYRREWKDGGGGAKQVFQTLLDPGAISAWHTHRRTTDRLFVASGACRIVLFDARRESRTVGALNVLLVGAARPALVTIPAGVWHGVQATSPAPSLLLNVVDRAYRYKDPDHWRLPPDSDRIPYRFPPMRKRDALK